MGSRAAAILLCAALLVGAALGCGGDETTSSAGEQSTCAAPEVALADGSCIHPGIAADGCAEGFVHDGGYGCEPILPPDPCAYGLMAAPGETECRSVMPCGEGRWGDLVVDAATVYVDASYAGGGSDGTDAKPFTTIGAAVAAAAPGDLIAVAAGRYAEDVVIEGKPVRLWGRCPEMVEIEGTGNFAAVKIASQASGTEVGGLAITGPAMGVALSGSENVSLARLWVRECGQLGINAESFLGATSLRVAGSLVELNHWYGMFVMGSEATVEGTVVRGTLPAASDQTLGRGMQIQLECYQAGCDPAARSVAAVRGSLVEHNHDIGLQVDGSDVTVEGSVVRGTLPRPTDQGGGRGINIRPSCTDNECDLATRAVVTVRGSLVEHNHEAGVFIEGSDATIESTVVRATLPHASSQTLGFGIFVDSLCSNDVCYPAARAVATVRGSLVERNHETGVLLIGSEAIIDSTVVRDSLPRASDQRSGRGISIQPLCHVETGCDAAFRSALTVRRSLVERNHMVGLLVHGSEATVDSSVVRATLPRASDGLFGDAIAVASIDVAASAMVSALLVDESARAGVSNFGAAVSLSSCLLRCTAFGLAGDSFAGRDFTFEDGGQNFCGCPVADGVCKMASAGLEPPGEPVPD